MKNKGLFFIPFFSLLLNFGGSLPAAPVSSDSSDVTIAVKPLAKKNGAPSSMPKSDGEDYGTSDFPLIKPGLEKDEVITWKLANEGKAFIDLRAQKATVIEPNGDRKIYGKVEGIPSKGLSLIVKQEEKELYGALEETNYRDGSADIYISRDLMATLDSSRRLIDLTLLDEAGGEKSLLANINLARHDFDAVDSARSIIQAVSTADLSRVPSDLRAQIAETLDSDLAFLDLVSHK